MEHGLDVAPRGPRTVVAHDHEPTPSGTRALDSHRGRLPARLGAELRRARRRQGWSLRTAGERLGLGYSYLAQLERGERLPSVAVAEALAGGLDLSGPVASELHALARPHAGRSWTPEAASP